MHDTLIAVDITMRELHKYVKDWLLANPAVTDSAAAVSAAIGERYPGADPREVLLQAEINWLRNERNEAARRAASNPEEWITTKVQGDLWQDWDVCVPPRFIVDGEARPYWDVSLDDQVPFFEARDQALAMEIDALQGAAEQKTVQRRRVRQALDRTRALITEARARGIDPATVRYAKKG